MNNKKLTKSLLKLLDKDNFNERIIAVIRDKNFVKKIKPTKPNDRTRNEYVKKIRSININNHTNLKRFIRNNNGKNIKSLYFLNIISFIGDKQLVEKLSWKSNIIKIDVDEQVILLEEELHTSNKTIKNNNNLWNHQRINKPIDYKVTNNILVSILDTGVDANHNELNGVIDLDKSTSFVKNDKSFVDHNGHGTHLAGIIGGKTCGICKDIKIMSVKCYNRKGIGSTDNLIQGIEHSIVAGSNVIQLFLNKNIDLDYQNGLDVALRKSLDIGIHICVSIEKSLTDMYKQIKTVGIIDKNGNKYIDGCKFYCPGIGIWSTFIDNKFKYLNGISMSTAHLTGLIASVLQTNQDVFPWNISIERDNEHVVQFHSIHH